MPSWPAFGETPRSAYVFPAGAQRGTKCTLRVGGVFVPDGAPVEFFGPQLNRQGKLRSTETIWFDNPVLNPPTAEGGDDRPRDFLFSFDIPKDAEPGTLNWRLWTSQGASISRPFVIGDLPEVVEEEIAGQPVPAQVVAPVTINGRIFPSEDVDVWKFHAKAGETWQLSVCAAEIGSPLRARLQLFGPDEGRIAIAHGTPERDPQLRFTADETGVHEIRIDDVRLDHTVANGGFHRPPPQSSVYRLTVSRTWNVTSVYPLGGRRGSKIHAELLGESMPRNEAIDVLLPIISAETWNTQFKVRGSSTNPVTFELSDLDEVLEQEPNDTPQRAPKLQWPAVFNGRIERPGDIDLFRVQLRRGEACDFELRSTRLRSPLNAVLSICDSKGTELLRDESLSEGQNDPSLRFRAPQEGEYLVRISGRLATRGGPAYAYRLYVTAAASDFQLTLPRDAVTVLRGAPPEPAPPKTRRRTRLKREDPVSARLPVTLDAAGPLSVPVKLTVEGLPAGVKVEGTEIAAGSLQTDLVFTTEKDIPIQSCLLTIRGSATLEQGKPPVVRKAFRQMRLSDPPIEQVRLAVAMPTPFKIRGATDYLQAPRGTVVRWQYLVDRNGYEGPIQVQLSDHQPRQLQGMYGPTITLAAGQTFLTYPAQLAPWMAAGRASRSAVMGFAPITDRDGSHHMVYYSAEDARSQIYMLVTAGPYSIETTESTQGARAGETIRVRVRVNREAGFRSAVRVTLQTPRHIHGLSAEPLVIPADMAEGTLPIRCTSPLGPLNMPVTLRGTSLDTPEPIESETQYELVDAN